MAGTMSMDASWLLRALPARTRRRPSGGNHQAGGMVAVVGVADDIAIGVHAGGDTVRVSCGQVLIQIQALSAVPLQTSAGAPKCSRPAHPPSPADLVRAIERGDFGVRISNGMQVHRRFSDPLQIIACCE